MSVTALSIPEVDQVPKTKPHPNSPEDQAEVQAISTWVNERYGLMNRTWRQFNDRTLIDYCDDNEKRINSYVPPRDEQLDDWQTIGFEGVTREKMFAFVAKVAMDRPKMKAKAIDKDGLIDKVVSDIADGIFQYSWKHEDPTDIKFMLEAWATAGHGTHIRFEGIEQDEELEQTYDSFDPQTGTVKGLKQETIVGDINAVSRSVRLVDFLVDNWNQEDIQKQSKVAEVERMTRAEFLLRYGDYKNAEAVPLMGDLLEMWGRGFYVEQWGQENLDTIVVLHYYEKNRKARNYRVVANGVMIAKTPIPRKDGNYPFNKFIFKPMADTSFFYGKAMPDEIAWDQDIYNAFKNMVIDRAILHINRPLIADGNNDITDIILAPNKVLNLKGNVTPLNYPAPDANDIAIMQELRASMDRQTMDSQQSGQVSGGATAREIVIADENARKLAGIFRKFLEKGEYDGAKLRFGTILEYYFEPKRVSEFIDDDEEEHVKEAFRSFTLDNQKLPNGATGTKILTLFGNKEDKPSNDDLTADALFAKTQGVELHKIAANVNYIKNFQIHFLVIPESSIQQSRSLELALESDYQKTVATLYPQKWQEYNDVFFRNLNEIYDKPMSDFETKQPPQAPQQPGMAPGGAPGAPVAGAQPMPPPQSAVNAIGA